MTKCLHSKDFKNLEILVSNNVNHIRIVIENVFFVFDQAFNHSIAPVNALKPDGFRASNYGNFVVKRLIKHSKPFSIPIKRVL